MAPSEGLEVLDPIGYDRRYVDRWIDPGTTSGDCVGRRPVTWGAPRWCFLLIDGGRPSRLLDFPESSRWRGCDEAWHAISAIDREAGHPHTVSVNDMGRTSTLSFDFPIPIWAERRLEIVGAAIDPPPRHLISYEVLSAEADEEVEFLRSHLWMEPRTENG